MFTGDGSLYNKSFLSFFAPNTFQTMQPYEFISDSYMNLFLSHDFSSLLFKTKRIQPEIVWQNNIGWGNLSNFNKKGLELYKTKDKVFVETGLKINNFLKLKTYNLGYIGIGAGVFYRYGAYSNANNSDNIVSKITLNYTIK